MFSYKNKVGSTLSDEDFLKASMHATQKVASCALNNRGAQLSYGIYEDEQGLRVEWKCDQDWDNYRDYVITIQPVGTQRQWLINECGFSEEEAAEAT